MNRIDYHRATLRHYCRNGLAVMFGIAAATAILTGSLLVGDSMRGSLKAAAMKRLSGVTHALIAPRFFGRELAETVIDGTARGIAESALEPKVPVVGTHFRAVPLVLLRGSAAHLSSRARAESVRVHGVDPRFPLPGADRLAEDEVILNASLARELGAQAGDEILLRTGKAGEISPETLLGRRDETVIARRFTVVAVLPNGGVGDMEISPSHRSPRNSFVSLASLQRLSNQNGKVNGLFFFDGGDPELSNELAMNDRLQSFLQSSWKPSDVGLTLTANERLGFVSLESDRFLIEPPIERAAEEAASAVQAPIQYVLTYLANSIESADAPTGATSIPYSTVSAIQFAGTDQTGFTLVDGSPAPSPREGEILLNEWAGRELQAHPGDRVRLRYYVTGSFGDIETRSHEFLVRGVIRMEGPAADATLTPDYAGITDARRLSDWDPPFPVDLTRIRPADEEYWDRHRATPKAFLSLNDGQSLWANQADRFGKVTSIRIRAASESSLQETAERFAEELRRRLPLASLGLSFEPVRDDALSAGAGNTDFGTLFLGFSFFLIASAVALVAILFRLGVEARARELGLLLCLGFTRNQIRTMLIVQGSILAAVGGLLGTASSSGFTWLMLSGLRTWWSAAANAPELSLYVSWTNLIIGFFSSVIIGIVVILLTVHSLTRRSAASLLAGVIEANVPARRPADRTEGPLRFPRRRGSRGIAMTAFLLLAVVALLLPRFSLDAFSEPAAFFTAGAFLLIAGLILTATRLSVPARGIVHRPGWKSWSRIGMRNAGRRRGRSLLTVGAMASAVFLIIAVGALHIDVNRALLHEKHSGTGGFKLFAESAVAIPFDLNTDAGRENANFRLPDAHADSIRFVPFRLRPGDEASCLNPYRPDAPRILGAPLQMLERGGFAFASSLAQDEEHRRNPWKLLDGEFPDGVIPAIGDEAAVRWQLHLRLGEDLIVRDEGSVERRLRFVALLKGTILQSEIVVSDANFRRLFPSLSGYGFFLIESSASNVDDASRELEAGLEPYGFDVQNCADRLADFASVQNTYLRTFQVLGAIGLAFGMLALAAVLVRNVRERRSELALLRVLGYSETAAGGIVFAEHAYLVVIGLFTGLIPAAFAVAPRLMDRRESLSGVQPLLAVAAVLLTGMVAGLAALRISLREPLLPALRRE